MVMAYIFIAAAQNLERVIVMAYMVMAYIFIAAAQNLERLYSYGLCSYGPKPRKRRRRVCR